MPFDPLPTPFVEALERCAGSACVTLDLGCGDGALATLMAAHGVRAVGLDLMPPAAGTAAAVVGDALNAPIGTGTCDLVVASNLVRHLAPRQPDLGFIANWVSLLKPTGDLFLLEDLPDDRRAAERNFARLQTHLAAVSPASRGPLLSKRIRGRLASLPGALLREEGQQGNRWPLDAGLVVAMLETGRPEPGGEAAALVADIREAGITCGSFWWARMGLGV